MEQKENTQIETAEELEAEQQHLAEVKEDEIRSNIISEYGFDEEDDKERIDKAVARELSHRKNLSTAIGQKRKYRDELKAFQKPETPPADAPKPNDDGEDLDAKVAQATQSALEKQALDNMEYPQEIKDAIKKVADINGTSVKEAVKDEYIASRIETWKKEQASEEAALNNTHEGGTRANEGGLIPPDVDMTTEEGRKEYEQWKKDQIAKGN